MAKKAKVIRHQGGFILEIVPDQQQERDSNPVPGEIVMNTELSAAVVSGLNHNLRTPLTMVHGFSELFVTRSTDPQIIGYAQAINGKTNFMLGNLDNLPKNGHQLKLVTDSQGNTNMSFIPAESSQASNPQL